MDLKREVPSNNTMPNVSNLLMDITLVQHVTAQVCEQQHLEPACQKPEAQHGPV